MGNEGGNSLTYSIGVLWRKQRWLSGVKRKDPKGTKENIQSNYLRPSSEIEGNFAVPCVCECDAVQQIIIQELTVSTVWISYKGHARILF